MNKDKFVTAGIQYIYDLEGYPDSSVSKQISKEFDELLELNDPAILQKRSEYFGIGEPSDYLNKLVKTKDGDVIAGIRHLNGDKEKPFISIWPSFQITSVKNIIAGILSGFEIFNPEYCSYWSRPNHKKTGVELLQQRFIGRISEMPSKNIHLQKADDYYDWYKNEYAIFHKENPEYVNRISTNSKQTMDQSKQDGLLYFYIKNNETIGLIAGEQDTFLNESAIYLNEILINHNHRGKGLSHNLLAGFISTLDAEYFICDIDSGNIPSTNTALRSGQKIFSQEIFERISG